MSGISESIFSGIALGILAFWQCYVAWLLVLFIKERLEDEREIKADSKERELIDELFRD